MDSVLRHGPMVCMKLPKADWDLLQRKQEGEQVADGYEQRLRGGSTEEFDINGSHTKGTAGSSPPGTLRIKRHPHSEDLIAHSQPPHSPAFIPGSTSPRRRPT